MPTLLVLNGPNLNMLGTREPSVYGTATLKDIKKICETTAKPLGYKIDFRQSNYEGEMVTWIQEAFKNQVEGVAINAAAYTHTSVAIHDALRLLSCPIVEVHLSDPKTRETFRHTSYVEPLAFTAICGHGPDGYRRAIEALAEKLKH
jgi:3-dehydroquinate dehydratase-2